jgi:hypothetical protein
MGDTTGRSALPEWFFVLHHLKGADGNFGGQRGEPILTAQDSQYLDKGGERRAFAPFQLLDHIQGNIGPLGQLALVDVLAKAERAQVLT